MRRDVALEAEPNPPESMTMADALRDMTAHRVDGTDRELDTGRGSAFLLTRWTR